MRKCDFRYTEWSRWCFWQWLVLQWRRTWGTYSSHGCFNGDLDFEAIPHCPRSYYLRFTAFIRLWLRKGRYYHARKCSFSSTSVWLQRSPQHLICSHAAGCCCSVWSGEIGQWPTWSWFRYFCACSEVITYLLYQFWTLLVCLLQLDIDRRVVKLGLKCLEIEESNTSGPCEVYSG